MTISDGTAVVVSVLFEFMADVSMFVAPAQVANLPLTLTTTTTTNCGVAGQQHSHQRRFTDTVYCGFLLWVDGWRLNLYIYIYVECKKMKGVSIK